MDRQQVFAALREMGVAKVEVSFQGGNDEGGVDVICLKDSHGTTMKELEDFYVGEGSIWDPESEKWVPSAQATPEQLLREALCRPVYDKYDSFGGEFYVYGKVVWNVASEKVTMDGQEIVESYEDFEEDV